MHASAVCQLCNRTFKVITNTHLHAAHTISIKEYEARFGRKGLGFALNLMKLPHTDPRWLKWKFSLAGRPPAWSKGFTKATHPSLKKTSKTFIANRIDNFKNYRRNHADPTAFSSLPLRRGGDLAELIGVTLGDGHIERLVRTEGLTIAANANNLGFIGRYQHLVRTLFRKEPWVKKSSRSQCVRIRIYQNNISKRLSIPTGKRRYVVNKIPSWIWTNRENLIRFLRGLYEAEGSFCVHKPTSTYKLLFANRNDSLLNIVRRSLRKLGFHPHNGRYQIQLSRKAEVYACIELLQFRKY